MQLRHRDFRRARLAANGGSRALVPGDVVDDFECPGGNGDDAPALLRLVASRALMALVEITLQVILVGLNSTLRRRPCTRTFPVVQ